MEEVSKIVQYIIVRKDLVSALKWPTGAVIAQACHASTAVMHLYYHDEITQRYLASLDKMHKIVLEVPDKDSLLELADTLTKECIDHKLWIEQPEKTPTCLAVKPYNKEVVKELMKDLKLFE